MIKRKSGASTEFGRVSIDAQSLAASGRPKGVEPGVRGLDREAIDIYLADMITQLEGLARATNKEMLAYLLSMASVQAVAPGTVGNGSTTLH